MKPGACPFAPAGLLLLLAAAAWPAALPAPWNLWLLPGLALLALLAGLLCGGLSARLWLAGALGLGWIALYAWNTSHDWSAGRGPVPIEHIRWLPASAFAEGTWGTFRLALAAFAAFALGARLTPRQIRAVQALALVAGVAMAFVVLFQRLEPNQPRIREYTGIFVNENHFAVFSNLLLPVVLVMASRARFRAVQDGKPSSPAGLLVLAALLMAAAVVLCGSRAGVAVMALLVAAHVWTAHRVVRAYPFAGVPISPWLKTLGWAGVVAAVGFAVRAFWREWTQLATIGKEWTFRSGILADALAAWKEHPVWGTGPGTFSSVFPLYQSEMFAHRAIQHAHCEPVQLLMEYGWAGAFVLTAAVGLALTLRARAAPAHTDEIPPFADCERRAFGFALLACALHTLIDFPLRIPLLTLLTAAWLGIWTATRPVLLVPNRKTVHG